MSALTDAGKIRDEKFPTKVRINEILFKDDGSGFIELRRDRPADKPGRKRLTPLLDYKLILLTSSPPQMVFEVDLGDPKLQLGDVETFYTIGTSLETSSVLLTAAGVYSSGTLGIFPGPKGTSLVVALVKRRPGKGFGDVVLSKCRTNVCDARPLTTKLLDTIINSVEDYVPVTSKADVLSAEEFPDYFERLPQFPATPFRLAPDQSWSYCGAAEATDFPSYQLSTPSPGLPNACKEIEGVMTTREACPEEQPTKSVFKEHTEARIRPNQFSQVEAFLNPTLTTELPRDCRKKLEEHGDLPQQSWIMKWLQAQQDHASCSFHCRHCRQFQRLGFWADQLKPSKRNKFISGFTSTSASEIATEIDKHHNSDQHQKALMFFEKIKTANTAAPKNEVFREFEKTEYDELLPTIRMVTLVAAETAAEVPFHSHSHFVDAMKSVGLDLGKHHFHNTGAQNIATVISDEFHVILLRSLIAGNLPFTIIADASTDNSNNALLSVMIQTLEVSHPMVYFYRLLKLEYGESAAGLFKTVQEAVDEDEKLVPGFREFVMKNLVSFSSDNAAAMSSDGTSLFASLRAWIGRPLFCSKCNSHKLELAIKHATEAKRYPGMETYASMEKKMNRIYVYYMSRGSKRWDRLKSIAQESQHPLVRFKPYYSVRWASSHEDVIRSVHRNYDVVLLDLVTTSLDDDVFLSTRNAAEVAEEIHQDLTDRAFPVVLNEMLDSFEVLGTLSKRLETSKSTILGKGDLVEEFTSKLERLPEQHGKYMDDFLKSCRCEKVCTVGQCTLKQYQNCDSPVCKEIRYEGKKEDLGRMKKKYYENLVSEIEGYFGIEKLRTTDIFLPGKYIVNGKLPSSLNEVKKYATDKKFKDFCAYFHFNAQDCSQLTLDYRAYMLKVFQNVKFSAFAREKDAVSFWVALLGTDSDLPTLVRRTVQSLLSIPSSSAACERIFSHMTRIKNRDRSSIKPETLEHLIRIKVNAPKRFEEFDGLYYTRKFVSKYSRVDDASYGGGRPAQCEKFRSWYDDSHLF